MTGYYLMVLWQNTMGRIFIIWIVLTLVENKGTSAIEIPTSLPARNENGGAPCTCTFRSPPVVVCTKYDADYLTTLNRVQDQLANLTSKIGLYQEKQIDGEEMIEEMERKLTRLTTTCLKSKGRIGESDIHGQHLSELSKHLITLESMMGDIKYDESYNDVMLAIDYKLKNLTLRLETISTEISEEKDEHLLIQADQLQSELDDCRSTPSDVQTHNNTQWPYRHTQDTCSRISQILQPFTLQQVSSASTWFTDPTDDELAIWVGPYQTSLCTSSSYNCRNYGYSYRKTVFTMRRFEDNEKFTKYKSDYLSYHLPDGIEGSTVVAYNGYLYYLQRDTKILVKFDITDNTTVLTNTLPSEIGTTGDLYQYTSGSRSAIDLEVDESGLWLIYATIGSQGLIVFSRLNDTTLDLGDTWYGNYPKKYLGNCFVICNTLYCVSAHDSHDSKVNYFYDTNIDKEGFLNVKFDGKYGEVSSLNYNPFYQKLFAMDNSHVVVYDLKFE